jgi:hypothetical protein
MWFEDRPGLNFPLYGMNIVRYKAIQSSIRVEIAIRAFMNTEGYVYIERNHFFIPSLSFYSILSFITSSVLLFREILANAFCFPYPS